MIPIYFYCCKEKPYLLDEGEFGLSHRFQAVYDPDPDEAKDLYLNGHIVARCEANEAFVIKFLGIDMSNCSSTYEFSSIHLDDLLKRSRLSVWKLFEYANQNDLFAIHLENVTPCDIDLSEFYKDNFHLMCHSPLNKAPQSWCSAIRKVPIGRDEFENHRIPDVKYEHYFDDKTYFKYEPCYIFADHSTYCADICNHFKDLEVRKTAPKELERK